MSLIAPLVDSALYSFMNNYNYWSFLWRPAWEKNAYFSLCIWVCCLCFFAYLFKFKSCICTAWAGFYICCRCYRRIICFFFLLANQMYVTSELFIPELLSFYSQKFFFFAQQANKSGLSAKHVSSKCKELNWLIIIVPSRCFSLFFFWSCQVQESRECKMETKRPPATACWASTAQLRSERG